MTIRSTHFPRAGNRLNPVASALLVLGLTAAGSAHAQATPAPEKDSKNADSVVQLDSVVITAGKRTEKQREIAGSVTALQGSDLEARGAKGQEDFFKLAPGVQFNKQEGDGSIITIRGIGTSAQTDVVQGTTGIYIEDVPFNDPYIFKTAPDVAPFDLQRVEILRGPQGVLFGSSSMGGAVRYLFNKPNLKQTELSVLGEFSATSGGGTNDAEYAMGNVALGESSAVRMVLFNRNEAGYLDSSALGLKDTNKLHQSGGRFLATFAPTRELNVTALYMTQATKVDDSSSIQDVDTLSKTNVLTLAPRKSQFDLTSLQVNYDLPSVRLTSTTGYLNKAVNGTIDASGYAAYYGPGAYLLTDEKSSATSQEFRVASQDGGPLSWLAGVFYQRYVYDQQNIVELPAWAMSMPNNIKSTAVESAAFAQGDYALDNGVTIGAGLRYYRTENHVVSSAVGGALPDTSNSGVTPRVSVKYKFGGGNLVYGLVSRGYRFGGFNVTALYPNAVDPSFVTPTTYQSDSLINYEIGLRLSPAKSVRLDATVFLIDWQDLQLGVPRPGDLIAYTANIGSARSQGLELSATWTPISTLALSSALAYTDAKTTADYNAPTGLAPSGTRLPGTPKFQIANQASMRFDGPMQTVGRVALTHTYVGKSFNDLFMSQEQGGYSLVDARIAFSRERWELSIFANNIANKKAVAGVYSAPPFFTDYFVTKPRTIGASLRFDL